MKKLSGLFLCFVSAGFLSAATPAFPGAEGGGMYTTGGRGGTVYYVNSLADTNTGNSTTREGTLRWCLSQSGKRVILFKVSGIIDLNSQLSISKGDVTIAGQTAPGDGICLRYYTTYIGTSNVIIRFMRFRLGDTKEQENDAIWGRERSDIMLDHCSMSWCVDECASFYSNKNFTMQWCLLAESLRNSIHGKGGHGYGGIWGGENATFHHNMLAHHDSRNPRFNGWKRKGLSYSSNIAEERLDFRNNVIYNWGSNSVYGGEAAGHYNMVNNYYKYGPATGSGVRTRIIEPWADPSTLYGLPYPKLYMTGNYMNGSTTVTATNSLGISNSTGVAVSNLLVSNPYTHNPVTTHSATTAFEKVLNYVGCSLKRDTVDARLVNEARNGTYTYTGSNGSTGGLIDTQSDVGGWPVYNSTTAPVDTDIDGMPDAWESSKGLNPNNASDGNTYTLDAQYTNLEVYLNSLVEGLVAAQNADGVWTGIEEPATLPAGELNFFSPSPGTLEVASEKAMTSLAIISLEGRCLLNQTLGAVHKASLSIDGLPRGMYLVRVHTTDGSIHTSKVMH